MKRLLLLLTLLAFAAPRPSLARPRKPVVIIISLDGFPAWRLHDPRLPIPALRRLQREGAAAAGMQPINPTVTWPNHTALITGVNAATHHVLFNGLLENQHDGPARIDPDATRAQLVHAQTLYDAAHEAGLRTAQADWVAIHHSGAIDWEFEERPDLASPLVQQLVREHVLNEDEVKTFVNAGSQEWRDNIYTRAMTDVIRQHGASLILLHLLSLDSISHRYGPESAASETAIAFLDDKVGEVLQAIKAAHADAYTTVFVVSDHGFAEVHHLIRANAVLKDAGLLDASPGDTHGAWAVPEGGFCPVYLGKDAPAGTAARLHDLFAKLEGVEHVYTPQEYAAIGLPTPSQSDQSPALYMIAKDGYSFTGGDSEAEEDTPDRGSHGYLNTDPKMQAIFIAWGAGIRPGVTLDSIPNLDVAPTAAKLLHLKLPHADGKPLTGILK